MKKSQRIAFDIDKAEIDTKVVTRDGHSGKITSIDLTKFYYPISATIELDGKEVSLIFTKEGRFYSDNRDSMFDLFLEEVDTKCTKNNIDENIIKACIGICLTDVNEQRFKNYNISLRDCLAWLEKQGEQKKLTDTIKPKFKIGDFIVNDYCMGKVNVVTNDAYLLNTGQGIPFSCDNTHLWTVKDAKPGNILFHSDSASNGIFIFKEITQVGEVVCYCDYDSEDGFCLGKFHLCCWDDSKILYPATEEQCDLLFQKIKEAGYQWNEEKKELNKINKEDKKLKKFDKEDKTRLMTHQELSDWLCQCPEECREFKYKEGSAVIKSHDYYENEANTLVNDILIRRNHGEWQESIIEE